LVLVIGATLARGQTGQPLFESSFISAVLGLPLRLPTLYSKGYRQCAPYGDSTYESAHLEIKTCLTSSDEGSEMDKAMQKLGAPVLLSKDVKADSNYSGQR